MTRIDYYDDPDAPAPNSLVPSVTAVVVDNDAILLVHKVDNNRWALPGGAIDVGESAAAAAMRETREETGIDIEIIGLVGIYTEPRHVMRYDDGEVRQQFSLCFRARATGGSLRSQPSETRAARWIPVEEVPVLDIHQSMRIRVGHGLTWSQSDPAHVG